MTSKLTQSEVKESTTGASAHPQSLAAARLPASEGLASVLYRLQRAYGNRVVQRVLSVARAADGPLTTSPDIESVIHRARGNGTLIENPLRTRMEMAFGASFDNVRIHHDSEADTLNRALHARAFTAGQDIYFRQGEYDPHSAGSRELLAHELTHVIQQGGAIQLKAMSSQSQLTAAGAEFLVIPPVAARAQDTQVQRMCQECDEEQEGHTRAGGKVQPKLTISQPDDASEQEADAVAQAVMRWESGNHSRLDGWSAREADSSQPHAGNQITGNRVRSDQVGRLIQRTPAPGRDFGTYRFCGFGITTSIPGFIQHYFTDEFDVDYTTGCSWIAGNAWDSVWELYDASDRRMDRNEETPVGDYAIRASDINRGTPGDGSAKWSLWYRITRSQPWLTGDSDAYPYHYREFDVYSSPIRNQNTRLVQELGEVIWQDNYTPAEDGASIHYNFSTSASRSTTDSQTTTASATVGGEQSRSVNFEYAGLTGGFANRLNYSATVSISRTHSVSVTTTQSTTRDFTQTGLRAGVTYSVTARPIYHLIDGSVDLISHRDGVISGTPSRISGAIRVLRGLDVRTEVSGGAAPTAGRGRWSCDASCNIEGTDAHCTGRVTGHSSGHSSQEEACREAKRDATQQAPRGCYARHCQCSNCTNR